LTDIKPCAIPPRHGTGFEFEHTVPPHFIGCCHESLGQCPDPWIAKPRPLMKAKAGFKIQPSKELTKRYRVKTARYLAV